ncbi:S8 family serine peptidase [Shewanella sp. 4_MG-2023]|uniref:S8 family peptidase n=1 Tax=Shewanella sp. 4_MG-2023 TaxID=3062652 RepID=UPI0026E2FBB9|nr:S8 family serine peptidase [Shewanella sp. 4_MG-2023]MDO6678194.1 S8 family serine peptidase [Shewanella sp. 4_MG-2023]
MEKLFTISLITTALLATSAQADTIRVVLSDSDIGQSRQMAAPMAQSKSLKTCLTAQESGEVICFTKPHSKAAQFSTSQIASTATANASNHYLVEINSEITTAEDLLSSLQHTNQFKTVELDSLATSQSDTNVLPPNDSFYDLQSYLHGNTVDHIQGLGFELANHLVSDIEDKVSVMIIDTSFANSNDMVYSGGYSFTDNDFAEIGKDFIIPDDVASDFHGTGVASIVGALRNNETGIAGAADNVSLFAARVGTGGQAWGYTIAQAILYAAQELDTTNYPDLEPLDKPMDVVNISMGSIDDACSFYMTDAIRLAQAKGVLIVASAGNENTNGKLYPASCSGIVNAGALSSTNEKSNYSNYGDTLSISAQGDNIYVLSRGDATNAVTMSGTSASSPLVAAAAAIAKRADNNIQSSVLSFLIESTSRTHMTASCISFGCGAGQLDASALTQAVIDLKDGNKPQINHALSDESASEQEWYVKHFGDKVPLCTTNQVNFLNGNSAKLNTFKLSRISKGTSFTDHLDNETAETPVEVLQTQDGILYFDEATQIDNESFDYAYQFCKEIGGNQICDEDFVQINEFSFESPEACSI